MKRNSPTTPLTPASGWSHRLRQLRNALVVIAALVAVAHTAGLPHLRWEYGFRGPRASPHIEWGLYVGPNGRIRIDAWRRPGGCPLIVFLKPCRPLWGLLDNLAEHQP
jgi:hypothetical protein